MDNLRKRIIRLTESDLHNIIRESVQKILKETYDPCDELGHLRWRNRDYRNDNKEAQRVGKVRGNALANWHKFVKDSESKVQEEGYDDEYNPHPDDNWHGYVNPTRERLDADEIPYKYKQRAYESKIKRAVEESVNEVMYNGRSYHGNNSNDWGDLAEASIYPGYNSTSTQDMTPINNKNYEYDPSTLTGIDKTMGHAQKFKYNGNNPEWFRETLRKSDGDDFNPDWMENVGVDFEGDTVFDIDSLYNSITEKLISAGVKDVTNVKPEYTDNEDEWCEIASLDSIKPYLSKSGLQRLYKRGYAYNWFIELGDKKFCSRHNFDDEDIAQENCDKYIKLIEGLGGFCDAYVDIISFENGKCMMDTCLVYEDFGDGPMWMD